jgi:hypothetical protein
MHATSFTGTTPDDVSTTCVRVVVVVVVVVVVGTCGSDKRGAGFIVFGVVCPSC